MTSQVFAGSVFHREGIAGAEALSAASKMAWVWSQPGEQRADRTKGWWALRVLLAQSFIQRRGDTLVTVML